MKASRITLLALLAAALGGCAASDWLAQQVSNNLAANGLITQSQAEGLHKTAVALRKSAEEISESEEYYIGRAVAAEILGKYRPLRDPALNLYAQKVAQAVSLSSDRPAVYKGYHVQVLDTPEINAFAAPGGFLFATKGLLDAIKSEDELACVLAHEVAHVSRKHGLKTIKTARLTQAFEVLGAESVKGYSSAQLSQLTSLFEGSIEDVVGKLVVDGYSRDKEFEADKLGAQYAKNANYDPAALKRLLSRLERSSDKGGVFRTHPPASSRLSELGELSASKDYRRSPERERRFKDALGAG